MKRYFICFEIFKKNQKILSCSTFMQTIYLNCIEDNIYITKNTWKYNFCSFTFFLVLVQIKNLMNY